jgi:hypothetical protein
MGLILWTRNFLQGQGFTVNDNVVHQDNQSAILLERNGRGSSGRRTHHIDIRYFFIADRIKDKQLRVAYCPTTEMLADFFTKPLQGALFRKMRAQIMNIDVNMPLPMTTRGPQECVETPSWARVVSKGLVRVSSDHKAKPVANQMILKISDKDMKKTNRQSS